MAMWMLILCLAVAELASAKQFIIRNYCGGSVLIGTLSHLGYKQPEDGAFLLKAGQEKVVEVADQWEGRLWPRTGCDENGRCQTGDCGGLWCYGSRGELLATLAEFSLGGPEGDFYDVSYVEGFNVPVTIMASGFCQEVGCYADLVPGCPERLKTNNGTACRNDNSDEARNYFSTHCDTALAFRNDEGKVRKCKNPLPYVINIC